MRALLPPTASNRIGSARSRAHACVNGNDRIRSWNLHIDNTTQHIEKGTQQDTVAEKIVLGDCMYSAGVTLTNAALDSTFVNAKKNIIT